MKNVLMPEPPAKTDSSIVPMDQTIQVYLSYVCPCTRANWFQIAAFSQKFLERFCDCLYGTSEDPDQTARM